MNKTKDYSDFPKKFREQIGTEVNYTYNRAEINKKSSGIIDDMRWSQAQIVNMKKINGPRYYGIQFRIKPKDGKRAFWTATFNSGIKIKRMES